MKRICAIAVIICIAVSLTGCDALQRKFTRKKKNTKPIPKLYQLKKYDIKPSAELYSKHYAYWASWMSELIQDLGQNRKKDTRCINEAVSQLRDMQNILVQQKAEELEKHIKKLEGVRDTITTEELSQFNRNQVLMTLEREDRSIKRDFSVAKIKAYVKESFDEAPPAEKSRASFSASMPSERASDETY